MFPESSPWGWYVLAKKMDLMKFRTCSAVLFTILFVVGKGGIF